MESPGLVANAPPALLPAGDHQHALVDAVSHQEVCLSEIGPDLVSGVVTVDNRTHTANILVHLGVFIRSYHPRVALLETGSFSGRLGNG